MEQSPVAISQHDIPLPGYAMAPHCPDAEMCLKTGQHDLFIWMVRREYRNLPFRHAVCIANRNHYIVSDSQLWMDYLTMAEELGMDTHNPQLVCPDDFMKAHDAVRSRIARLYRAKSRAEHRRWTIENREDSYRKTKGKYFGITFGNEQISVSVIKSVAEMAEEGECMHHCVFEAGYYKKPDALILSARDSDGNRLETIEINLPTLRVVQSRARFNQQSPLHEEILRLIHRNIHLFKQIS